MIKSDRVDNPAVREYLYQFAPQKINANPLFVKVFGKRFASKRIRSNLIVAYTNETNSLKHYDGYHNGREKSVTICRAGKDGAMLSPEDIVNDTKLQEIALHEAIHAMLEKSRKECQKIGIASGTGVLEKYEDPVSGAVAEWGRGLNEGFTEWLCEQAGYQTHAYTELTNIVRLLELAIGTEQVMELGKGDTQHRFSNILKMTQDEVNYLLTVTDQIYNENDYIQVLDNLARVIENYYREEKNGTLEQDSEALKEYENYKEIIDRYMKDPVFLNYAKTEGKDISLHTFQTYLEKVCIPKHEKQKNGAVIAAESFIIDRYFMRDIRAALNQEVVSDKDFEKVSKMISLLNTRLYSIPEYLKNQKPPMSSVVVREEYKEFSEKYVRQVAKREAEKYQNGELMIEEFIGNAKRICTNHVKLPELFVEEFAKYVAPEFASELKDVIDAMWKYSDNEKFIKRFLEMSVYKLISEDEQIEMRSTILYSKNNYFSQWSNGKKFTSTVDPEFEFSFTEDYSVDDEYKSAMNNFLALKKHIFEKNLDANIFIVDRAIIVQEGENTTFYMIEKGEIIPMQVERKLDLHFKSKERELNQEKSGLPAVKVGWMASFVNKIKRVWNDLKNKESNGTPNYIENEEIVKEKQETKIDAYRVDDFEKRFSVRKENTPVQNSEVQETNHEIDQEEQK